MGAANEAQLKLTCINPKTTKPNPSMKLGIGITTTPSGRPIGDIKVSNDTLVSIHTDAKAIGVSRSRNNLIKELYDKGCTHIAIMDDDLTYLKQGWFEYAAQVMDANNLQVVGLHNVFGSRKIYSNKGWSGWSNWLGCVHIFTRKFIEDVGYFCTAFDRYGYEDSHLQWRVAMQYPELNDARPVPDLLPHYILSHDVYEMHPIVNIEKPEKLRLIEKNRIILDQEIEKGTIYYPYKQ